MTRKLFMIVALGLALYAAAQDHPQSNERRNLGFKGPVHSALVTVERPNPDPRARDKRALFLPGGPDSIVFDTNGSRIEFATGFSGDQIVQTSTRTAIKSDGTEIWTNSQGNASETRKQYAVLADGSREVTYYSNSQVTNREVTRFDDQGRIVEFHNYNAEGNLISEQSTSFNHQRQIDTFKLYDQHGRIVHETRTAIAGEERLDRWQYDSGGQLGWHVAVNGKGELLTSWYASGYKPNFSSSDSLGVCGREGCTAYKFNEQGQLEKTVQHTRAENYIEPDREEHYDAAGNMDEKIEISYMHDAYGNWISRSILVWDAASNQMIEVERDSRKIDYY